MESEQGPGPFLTFLEKLPVVDGDSDSLTIADVQEHFGQRSFGPFLLLAALPLVTPLVNIPGVATVLGIVIFLTSAQILIGRSSIWLPSVIRRRSVRRDHIQRTIKFTRPAARWIDRLIRRRFEIMTRPPMLYVIALICALLGLLMPLLEYVPGTSAIPAVPVVAFGLGIAMHDGAVVVVGLVALAVIVGTAIGLGSIFI